jgi:hypothetical protein
VELLRTTPRFGPEAQGFRSPGKKAAIPRRTARSRGRFSSKVGASRIRGRTQGGVPVAGHEQAPKDPTLDAVIADTGSWKDHVRLADLRPYMFETTTGKNRYAVRLSFVLAHGKDGKTTTTPATLGELRQGFEGHNAFEDPGGNHNRSQIVAHWNDPKSGKEVSGRVPTAMIYVESSTRSRGGESTA